MRRSRARLVLVAIVVGCIAIGLSVLLSHVSLKELTINYENIKGVTVYNSNDLAAEGADPRPVTTVDSSGKVLKLPEGSYILRYDGEEGYESNSEEIKLTKEQQTITLNPPYSEPKLASILKTEAYYIGQVLHSAYPKIDEYEIQPGQLYNKGEWFGTTLIYKGEDYFNTDTLRVILHKENGQWIIKTRPPNIILSKVDFPDIPINILRKVNSQ